MLRRERRGQPVDRVECDGGALDQPGAVDQRDRRALAVRASAAVEIGRQAGQLGASPGARTGIGDHLVAIAEAIDELRLERLIGQQRAVIDCRADFGLRQVAARGDAADYLPRDRGEQRIDLLAMRRGHLGFGQTVHRGFEFFAMVELRSDPEKIERAL